LDRGEQARALPSVPCLFFLIARGGPLVAALDGWY
jgi:hypothetical protein